VRPSPVAPWMAETMMMRECGPTSPEQRSYPSPTVGGACGGLGQGTLLVVSSSTPWSPIQLCFRKVGETLRR